VDIGNWSVQTLTSQHPVPPDFETLSSSILHPLILGEGAPGNFASMRNDAKLMRNFFRIDVK
jgi:hypothetical protein